MKPVIKWTGSKRKQAVRIYNLFPDFENYYEPFLGGGSMLYITNPKIGICSDICNPLIGIWKIIKNRPRDLVEYYNYEWNRLQKEGHEVYYEIRDRFNKKEEPLDLFFLSRTCVNGLIRFNQKGEFNNSFHHTRKGINPKRLEKIIFEWTKRIQNVEFIAGDYQETTKSITKNDFIYLDPPYFNTKGRYYGSIDYKRFLEFLHHLNQLGVKYALSFDGKRGKKSYMVDLPDNLYKRHLFLDSGNSSFKKVMDKKVEKVKESLYLNY